MCTAEKITDSERQAREILSGDDYMDCPLGARIPKATCIKRQTIGIIVNGGRSCGRGYIPAECENCEQGQMILAESRGEITMANKKGTCSNCGRGPLSIMGTKDGFCWACYMAQKGKAGEDRERALAEKRDFLQGKVPQSKPQEKKSTSIPNESKPKTKELLEPKEGYISRRPFLSIEFILDPDALYEVADGILTRMRDALKLGD
ncbi:MAG: hypothetical protein JXA07_04070 [Spirochaetes bacterium]|nr:hypothetical protein [Spirochaetota bacterium]